MNSTRIAIGCLVMFLVQSACLAQNYLSQPESAVYDQARDRYLISNYSNGRIIQINSDGVQSVFAAGKSSSAGLHIVGDSLYVGCGSQGVLGYNLETAEVIMDVTIPGSQLLNDITSDTSGYLYVSDPFADKVYKISLDDHSYSTLIDYIVWPNGLMFDERNNRLLGCTSTNRWIYAADLDDGTITPLVHADLGHLDGLADDSAGNIYVSAQGINAVYRYDSTYSEPPELVSRSHNVPADIYYNKLDNVLVVPEIGGTTVDFVDLGLPELFYDGLIVVDSAGGSSKHTQPGETVDIYPIIRNFGYAASGLNVTVTSLNPFVTVLGSEASFTGTVEHGDSKTSNTPFRVDVNPSCPEPHVAALRLEIQADGEYVKGDTLLLFIGDTPGFSDDMESGTGYWRHRSLSRLYGDTWRQDQDCQHSGTTSWRPGYSSYSNYLDAGLISPPFLLEPSSALTFWHRIFAEEDTEPGKAFDGGLVLLMTLDGEWTQITPEGGYSHTTIVGPESPLRSETPVFSGNVGWTEVYFDLSEYSGTVQLLFRFASDGGVTGSGWCIDDVEVAIDPDMCCTGMTGNVDGDLADGIDLSDLTALIDFLFISFEPPRCIAEANTDGDSEGSVDLGDLTSLIDYLFISFTTPAECP